MIADSSLEVRGLDDAVAGSGNRFVRATSTDMHQRRLETSGAYVSKAIRIFTTTRKI